MARFQKSRLHVIAAVLVLLGLYALGGLVYAFAVHSRESVEIWAAVAGLAFVAAVVYQRYSATKRRRMVEQDG